MEWVPTYIHQSSVITTHFSVSIKIFVSKTKRESMMKETLGLRNVGRTRYLDGNGHQEGCDYKVLLTRARGKRLLVYLQPI